MAAVATSPRRALTAEEKEARDAQFRVDTKTFGLILKRLVKNFNNLTHLNTALGQGGKGSFLTWETQTPEGVRHIPFNRKHLRSANAAFAKDVMALKNYHRVALKRKRETIKPESFKGTYTPVYAGPALQTFFTAAPGNFGPLHPLTAAQTGVAGQALMDSLPMVQQGYLLRNTNTLLFYIYAHANQLQSEIDSRFARSDDVMNQAFGGQIPAALYAVADADGKQVKFTMDQAVASGYIPAPMNTYQVIAEKRTRDIGRNDFDPNNFNTYFYQNISSYNYYPKSILQQPEFKNAADALARADMRQQMLNEFYIVKGVSAEWKAVLEPTRKAKRDANKKANDARKKALRA